MWVVILITTKLHPEQKFFPPMIFMGPNNILYLNCDGRRFIDVTKSIGTGGSGHLTLGVALAYYNSYEGIDLYLPNDTDQKILY